MVDFNKLRGQRPKTKAIEPIEVFRRLPKPTGINDLYSSQAEVLQSWFAKRNERDTIVKLHTGGGKTLVGLLIAQSTLNETGGPVLYLAPNRQLVAQAIEKARAIGIPAVEYSKGQPLDSSFANGQAIMVATYKALFNGRSKFGLRGGGKTPQSVSAIILDDAHVSFGLVREAFTLNVEQSTAPERYRSLVSLFRLSFADIDRLGSFDDTISGKNFGVMEVSHTAWLTHADAVRAILKDCTEEYALQWPLLRDHLHLCHALISGKKFTITPILPIVSLFPTFADASRRIYMSATISDESDIIRNFDADPNSARNALTSRSLAGVSERMILIPELMPFALDVRESVDKLLDWVVARKQGAVVLVQSDTLALEWSNTATVAIGTGLAEAQIQALQNGTAFGPVVFSNRYDGIDLPGDSCRLLVLQGLPIGTSDYEIFKGGVLFGAASIAMSIAQKIEQGMGRGARGAGDYCVVVLMGTDLSSWVAKISNFRHLTTATQAQLDIGAEVSKSIVDQKDLARTIKRSIDRDPEWMEFHAEALAERVSNEVGVASRLEEAVAERKAFNLWADGNHQKALSKIELFLASIDGCDKQMRGWLQQFASRIASHWGNAERAQDFQQQAYSNNRNLTRPRVRPPYRPALYESSQARLIVKEIGDYRVRRGYLRRYDEVVSFLTASSSANQFENALMILAQMIGFIGERYDLNGEGPDVLWLLPDSLGIVIEAKSRKKEKNALTKEEHGQLLVAEQWFSQHYTGYKCVRVSVHPRPTATAAAVANASYALTYEKIGELVSDARSLLAALCESELPNSQMEGEANRLLLSSKIRADRFVSSYLQEFTK